MEIKRIILILAIIIAIIIPWYIKYKPHFFKKNRCSKETSLIEMNKNLNKLNICNNEEFDLLIKILSKNSSDLQFIHLLPKEEQYKIYAKLLENYVIDAYIVKEYLSQEHIDTEPVFVNNRDLYLKIMENNFNMDMFKKNISDSITLDDVFAKQYYEENKDTLFSNIPFTKITPGINANAIIIDDEKKNDTFYEKMLLDKKNCIPIENYNPKIMQISDSNLANALMDMKIKEYRKIILQNGQKIMVYKLSENDGEWVPYEVIADKVKAIAKKRLTEEKCNKKINELKNFFKIMISQKNLDQYIEKKNIILKNQYSDLDSSINKILSVDSNIDSINDELIEEQDIKNVEQGVVA